MPAPPRFRAAPCDATTIVVLLPDVAMIADPIAHHALRQPDAIALALAKGNISYRVFDRGIDMMAAALRPDVEKGMLVAVSLDNLYVHWVVLMALARLSAVSVSVEPKVAERMLDLHRPALVIAAADLPVPQGTRLKLIDNDWIATWVARVGSADPAPSLPRPGPDDPVRLVTSSGTTGRPKRILFTHGQVVQRIRNGVFGQLMRYDPRILVLVGIDTFGGFGAPLRTWWFGGTVCIFKPEGEKLLAHDVRALVVSPRQLQNLLRKLPPDFTPMPNLTVTVGGSGLPREVGREARMRLSPNVMLTYGSTETTTVATAPVAFKDRDPEVTGIVVPWAEIEAVDTEGNVLPPGQVGEIRIRCSEMISGYVDDPETSARHFRGGWFYPGDVGSVSARGLLKILGRSDDILNFSGAKVSPDLVEDAIAHVAGVSDQAVFALADPSGIDQPWAAVVVAAGTDLEAVRQAVGQVMPWARSRLRIMPMPEIPRNAMGKIERYKLRAVAQSRQDRQAPPQPAMLRG
ncbi:MAG: class I adenylate-forming enzyme family protein [Devosia sp.]